MKVLHLKLLLLLFFQGNLMFNILHEHILKGSITLSSKCKSIQFYRLLVYVKPLLRQDSEEKTEKLGEDRREDIQYKATQWIQTMSCAVAL